MPPAFAKLLALVHPAQLNFGLTVGVFKFGPIETILLGVATTMAIWSLVELFHVLKLAIRRARIEALRGQLESGANLPPPQLPWYQQLGAIVAVSPVIGTVEQGKMLGLLASAGIKGPRRLATFIAIKLAGALVLPPVAWLALEAGGYFTELMLIRVIIVLGTVVLGWRLPDLVVVRMARRRKVRLEMGMPDAIDLLVICAEAGLGLEAAVDQVAHDLRRSNPEVADEFATTSSEMRVLADRRNALENLAQRTGLGALRSMVSTLNQSIRFGTPLSESLRILAAEMRAVRLSRFEERGARLPVLLTLPMMLFIMPCLFLVLGGPIALHAIDNFSK